MRCQICPTTVRTLLELIFGIGGHSNIFWFRYPDWFPQNTLAFCERQGGSVPPVRVRRVRPRPRPPSSINSWPDRICPLSIHRGRRGWPPATATAAMPPPSPCFSSNLFHPPFCPLVRPPFTNSLCEVKSTKAIFFLARVVWCKGGSLMCWSFHDSLRSLCKSTILLT